MLNQIRIIKKENNDYPFYLKEISSPPKTLYCRGNLQYNPNRALAIVGSRKASPYGISVATKIAADLAECDFTIISGLAYGIDRAAHEACLKAGGKTIAVLGSGIDPKSIYPKSHLSLSQKIIASNGAVLSEFPPETQPRPEFFPQRNRVISGLSRGILIVEAGEKSGALITARFALEQNRDIFAVPGPINSPYSIGSNQLIKNGAKLVTSFKDILEDWNISLANSKKEIQAPPLDNRQEIVYKAIQEKPLSVDEILQKNYFASSETMAILSEMEIASIIKKSNGKYYPCI